MGKNKRNNGEERKTDVGLVMSVSLFLILLTFFILLNSIAVIDEEKKLQAIGSLLGSFGSFLGGLSPLKTGDSLMPPSAPMVEECIKISDLFSIMDKNTLSDVVIESRKDMQIITINEKVLFDKNKLHLKPSSYPMLNNLCKFVKKRDYPIEIFGYTDSMPPEGKGCESNWEVSVLMATQIARYLLEKGEVRQGRLAAYGCGSNKPIASNDTRESRAQNRRIEIALRFKVPKYVSRIYEERPNGVFTYKKFDFKVFE